MRTNQDSRTKVLRIGVVSGLSLAKAKRLVPSYSYKPKIPVAINMPVGTIKRILAGAI